MVERKGIFRIGRNYCASLAPSQEGGIAYGRGEGGGRCGEGCRAAHGVGGAYGCRELGGIAVGDVEDKVDGLSVHVVLGIAQAVVGEAQAQAALADAGVCRHGRGEVHLLAYGKFLRGFKHAVAVPVEVGEALRALCRRGVEAERCLQFPAAGEGGLRVGEEGVPLRGLHAAGRGGRAAERGDGVAQGREGCRALHGGLGDIRA